MMEGICLAITIATVVVVIVVVACIVPTCTLGHEIKTIRGHDYLIICGDCSCCAIHAESCPCKSGKDTGGVR